MRTYVLALAAAAFIHSAVPASAQQSSDAQMASVLENDRRADDAARDQYRNPAETLAFFRVEPEMTVAEYAPGGGWYTRVLAPYVAAEGRYVAIGGDSDTLNIDNEETAQRMRAWPQTFPAQAAQWTGLDAAQIAAHESDEVPEAMRGTVDRVLIFRSLHGLLGANRADSELRNLREFLADDGMVGVVQHRAKPDAPYAYSDGSKGYLREADVVKLFELNGFELVEKSEINANANDPADWEDGVWTLPPTYALDEQDRERYSAIGESDRMTLLFRKRA